MTDDATTDRFQGDAPASDLALDDPIELARRLKPASARLVVLDFDGVLSHIVDHPELAAAADGALDALRSLMATTTVAVVSGRPVAELRRRLDDLAVTYAGAHGAELVYADGALDHLADPEDVASVLDTVEQELRDQVDDEPGWLVERKATSLAVHHRLATDDSITERLPRIVATMEHHAQQPPGFNVLAGKAVSELRPTGVDKGLALERIAARTPERKPLVLGDDVTDEDAFRVALDLGGDAILVADEPRATQARNRLQDPDAVVGFLTELARPEG